MVRQAHHERVNRPLHRGRFFCLQNMSILQEGDRCWCCDVPLSECKGDKVPAQKIDREKLWKNIEEVFGERGMPSCGMTDANILSGSDDKKPARGTVYLK